MATLTKPDAVAMDSQKLEQVNQLFQRQVDEGLHPGVFYYLVEKREQCWAPAYGLQPMLWPDPMQQPCDHFQSSLDQNLVIY